MSAYIALLLCITPIAHKTDRDVLAQVAHSRGYDIFIGHDAGCAAEILIGAEDLAGARIWTFDDSRPMNEDRANKLITAWEARLK